METDDQNEHWEEKEDPIHQQINNKNITIKTRRYIIQLKEITKPPYHAIQDHLVRIEKKHRHQEPLKQLLRGIIYEQQIQSQNEYLLHLNNISSRKTREEMIQLLATYPLLPQVVHIQNNTKQHQMKTYTSPR